MAVELTITIPTFNRPERIKERLKQMALLVRPGIRVLILDNHSDLPIEHIARELGVWGENWLTVVRHEVNIGGNANILRCFELCQTEWMWLFSDDDSIADGGLAFVLDAISRHPKALWISFRDPEWISQSAQPKETVHNGLKEMLAIKSFSNSLFISNSLFQVNEMKNRLIDGFQGIRSMAPHLAICWSAIGENGEWVLSDRVVTERRDPPKEDTFPMWEVVSSLPILFEVSGLRKFQSILFPLILKKGEFYSFHCVVHSAIKAATMGRLRSITREILLVWIRLGMPFSPRWLIIIFTAPTWWMIAPAYRRFMHKELAKLESQYAR